MYICINTYLHTVFFLKPWTLYHSCCQLSLQVFIMGDAAGNGGDASSAPQTPLPQKQRVAEESQEKLEKQGLSPLEASALKTEGVNPKQIALFLASQVMRETCVESAGDGWKGEGVNAEQMA